MLQPPSSAAFAGESCAETAQGAIYLCGKISLAMMEPEELPEFDPPQVTDILQSHVDSIHAQVVRLRQADAETITADEVGLQQSAAGNIKANHLSVHQSAIGMANATEVSVVSGAVGFVQAEKMSAGGYTGVIVAGSAEVQHGMAVFVAGRDVHVNESRTGILLARNLYGNVTTLLDTRGALIMGLVGGLFAGLMLLLGRVLFGRK